MMKTEEKFIKDIREASDDSRIRLTDVEERFIDSMELAILSGKNATRKQREWMDQIHDRISLW
jgi:hypothetical protein